MSDYWKDKRVCVLGGAGFIGSHLAEALVNIAKSVIVADDLSSGDTLVDGALFIKTDLRDYNNYLRVVKNCDIVLHFASDVGGRAYLEKNNVWGNIELDSTVFRACAGKRVVFASSACVYPPGHYFSEDMTSAFEEADGIYGMEKLIAERILTDSSIVNVRVRPFTVYGERMKENRSIGALVAKTFIKQDPFEVWGSGCQVTDWVYVKDVVNGVLLATEKISGAVNIGSGSLHTPMDALRVIWNHVQWEPEKVVFRADMPTSPERLADNTKLRGLGWETTSFERGLQNTVDWYFQTHSVKDVKENLERRLVER